MPRTVTVTFDDGTSHVYENTPDDVTPDQITERAAKDFDGKTVTKLDGGKKAAPAKTEVSPVEDAGPTTSEDGRKLTPEAARMEKLARKVASKNGGLIDLAKGVGETGLSMATGLASMAAGGIMGGARSLYSLASGEGLDTATQKGAETIGKVQQMGTYQPRGDTGKLLNEVAGTVGGAPGEVIGSYGGDIGEAMGGEQGRLRGEAVGKVLPAIVPAAVGLKGSLKAMGRPAAESSRGASKLRDAMRDMTPDEIQQARELIAKSNEAGVPLTGPEAFKIAPKLHELMTDVDKSNGIVARFVKERPEQAKAAIQKQLDEVGDDVGLHEAANRAQEAADTVITDAQKFRTEASSPDYKAQRASDAEAIQLMDDLKSRQKDIKDGTAWKNDAIQQAGRWYQFSHEMGLKANEVASKVLDWAKGSQRPKEGDPLTVAEWQAEVLKDHPTAKFTLEDGSHKTYGNEGDWTAHTGPDMQSDVVGVHSDGNGFASVWDKAKREDKEFTTRTDDGVNTFENEGGRIDENASKREASQNYMARADEGKAATQDAVQIARDRQNYIDGWQKEVAAKADQLAEKNLPLIQEKLRGFMATLDSKIRLMHPDTEEGQILTQFKNDLAPNGTPLTLPSQLESVYKSNRDKLELTLQSTRMDRTTAGVLKGDVKALDALIQEVSPAIKQGRDIYSQLSREFVDPLMKSPVGRIAGKGAEAQKEALVSRITTELQGDAATPDRIRMLADNLNKVDSEAFPNIVRAQLETKFNKAAAEKVGQNDRLTGAKFAESIASTPKDRANIAAMIEKSAEAQGKTANEARAAARGFSNLIEVLQGTGRIMKIGVQGIEESSMLEKAALAAPHTKAYGTSKALTDSIRAFINKKAYENLAKVFTDPNSIDKMVRLANTKATNKEARQKLVAELLDDAVAPTVVGAALAPEDAK